MRSVEYNGVVPLPDVEIQVLRCRLTQGICGEPCSYLTAAPHVQVARGTLEGMFGIVLMKKTSVKVIGASWSHEAFGVFRDRSNNAGSPAGTTDELDVHPCHPLDSCRRLMASDLRETIGIKIGT